MTVRILTSSGTNTPHGFSLPAGDDLVVAPGVTVVGASGDGVHIEDAAGRSARILGTVIGTDDGIEVSSGSSNFSVIVSDTGTVSGRWGIYAPSQDGLRVTNFGNIVGVAAGIYATGNSSVITNYGTLAAANGDGVHLGSRTDAAGTESRLVNFGTVSGTVHSVLGDLGWGDIVRNHGTLHGYVELLGGADRLVNRGGIIGDVDMGIGDDVLDNRHGQISGDIHMGDGVDTLYNQDGRITGTIWLDAGNDVYDGRGGEVLGTVYGGLDNDNFIGNALAVDTFDGGDGSDLIDFRNGPAVTLALDGSFVNDGAALGDNYANIERVAGSLRGDVLRGSATANTLNGQAGADSLDGAAGNDVLYGGAGIDTLTGGAGNDTFRFGARSEFGDTINDFGAATGNNDLFQLAAAALGGGLVAGALAPSVFVSRADNAAQDANDRFIFRTTDTTLWFDVDGSGAQAAVMVANVQAGVALSVADILLF